MAHRCDIYVWIPKGPLQLLGSRPEMIIKPVMKEPLMDGYIDRVHPHTINNIIVDDLGRDEVLLLATDSGNVCGYHVEAIYSAVKRCAKSGYKRPFDGSEVNPFFVENVGMSAWGLATHKYARLIAVSANTGLITVYAFALVDSAADDRNDADETSNDINTGMSAVDQTWVPVESRKQLFELHQLTPRNYRSRNLRLTYRGHFDNIPCVSFANFDLNPNGMWMVSTDISNRLIIWRIWEDLWPTRVYYPGHPSNNPPQRGWSVIPLDPRTFRPCRTIEEACGCKPDAQNIAQRTILDTSRAIEGVPDASQIFVYGFKYKDSSKDVAPAYIPDDIFSSDCCIDDTRRPHPYLGLEDSVPWKFDAVYGVNREAERNSETRFYNTSSPHQNRDNDSQPDRTRRSRVQSNMSSLVVESDHDDHHRVPPCLYPDGSEGDPDPSLSLLKSKAVHRKPNPSLDKQPKKSEETNILLYSTKSKFLPSNPFLRTPHQSSRIPNGLRIPNSLQKPTIPTRLPARRNKFTMRSLQHGQIHPRTRSRDSSLSKGSRCHNFFNMARRDRIDISIRLDCPIFNARS